MWLLGLYQTHPLGNKTLFCQSSQGHFMMEAFCCLWMRNALLQCMAPAFFSALTRFSVRQWAYGPVSMSSLSWPASRHHSSLPHSHDLSKVLCGPYASLLYFPHTHYTPSSRVWETFVGLLLEAWSQRLRSLSVVISQRKAQVKPIPWSLTT